MLRSRNSRVIWRCGTWIITFVVLLWFSKANAYERKHSLKRYRPIPYRSYNNDVRTIKRRPIVNDVTNTRQSVMPIRTSSTKTLIPRRRLIYSVVQPTKIRKVLTEENGKLVYKKVPNQRPTTRTPSKVQTSHFPPSVPEKNRSSFDRDFDQLEPPEYQLPGHPSVTVYDSTYRSTSIIRSRYNEPEIQHPRMISTYSNIHTRPSSNTKTHLLRNNDFTFLSDNPSSRTNYVENERKFLSNIVPPPGLKMVVVRGNKYSVDLRSAKRFGKIKTQTHSPDKRRRFHVPANTKISPGHSSRKVLRFRVATVDEARALLENVGPGFKVTVVNETTSASTPLFITTVPQVHKTTASNSFTNTSQLPSITIASTSLPSTTANATTADLKQWWTGKNVCVKESPGMFGLNKAIRKKIRTVNTCIEKRNRYICTENYGFGANTPMKTTTYRCCNGYVISANRRRCKLPLPTGNEASPDESILVQKFLENHVIPNKLLRSSQMHNDQILKAVSGNPIRVNFYATDMENVMTVNCRKVVTPDIVHENSVIHFTDKIIEDVQGTMYEYLSERPQNFSAFLSVLDASGFSKQLQVGNGSYTLFVPVNSAFAAISHFQSRTKSCMNVLALSHIVDNVVCTAGAEIRKRNVTTMQGEQKFVHKNQQQMYVDGAQIIIQDVMTSNGVIHIIDKVLKPTSGFAESVLDVLESNLEYSSALELFQAANITEGLVAGNNFTVIVPSNKAFKRISKREKMHLRTNLDDLTSTLMYYLIPSSLNFDELTRNQMVETLYPPHNLHVSIYSMKIRISSGTSKKRFIRKPATSLQCARVVNYPPQKPCNGQIFVVDKVLKPPSGTLLSTLMLSKTSNFTTLLTAVKNAGLEQILDGNQVLTMFAPSEAAFSRFPAHVTERLLNNKKLLIRVLKFHIISGFRCEHELLQRPSRHRTLLRSTILSCPKRRKLYLGRRKKRLRAKVVESNIEATNGVIHAIDNLLLPRKFRLF